ncbi:hypothetical protein ISP15_07865 [Dyella jejuensis]|uniref:Intracellular septation protein A n=1 Tax=Dyella jejuensis TaxID=1432009 RepID=A0ABW8JHE9_9GAMM
MGILLAFAPFIVFAVLDRLIGATGALVAGALVSAALLLRDWIVSGRKLKILEAGTTFLFGALALYAVLGAPTWSVIGIRLYVDSGLLLIVLASLAARRPFTLQYAREQVDPELWGSRAFIRTNYVLTGAWALAFAMMVAAEFALLYVPALPRRIGIIIVVLALVGAVKFTSWYPKHVRRSQRS